MSGSNIVLFLLQDQVGPLCLSRPRYIFHISLSMTSNTFEHLAFTHELHDCIAAQREQVGLYLKEVVEEKAYHKTRRHY